MSSNGDCAPLKLVALTFTHRYRFPERPKRHWRKLEQAEPKFVAQL